jgi:cold shock protein
MSRWCHADVWALAVSAKAGRRPLQTNTGEIMSTGLVKMYDENRGFGFIQPDDGGVDLFVHAKSIVGASELTPGQTVEFESEFDRDRGKYRATDVRVI